MLGSACFAATALLGALLTQSSPAAWADFRQVPTSRAEFGADVLQPPSGLAGWSDRCGQVGARIDLQWTASPTSWLERYDVLLATTAGGPYTLVPP